MIRLTKPTAPTVLTTRGLHATNDLCDEYDRSPAYRRGKKHFTFSNDIYAHDEVKAALRTLQRDKCAFCESKITHIGFGDVEHFRPKGGFRQKDTDPLQYPGYYWLAYQWDNLFLSCQLCNQRFKRERFPVRVQKRRARSHKADLSKEDSLLIYPANAPELYLTFSGEMAVPVKRNTRGRVTIEVMGLNRPELVERRLERRRVLLTARDARDELLRRTPPPIPAKAQAVLNALEAILRNAVADEAEYAAMARVTLA